MEKKGSGRPRTRFWQNEDFLKGRRHRPNASVERAKTENLKEAKVVLRAVIDELFPLPKPKLF